MVRLTVPPDMTLDVYCGRKTTKQQMFHKTVSGIMFCSDMTDGNQHITIPHDNINPYKMPKS